MNLSIFSCGARWCGRRTRHLIPGMGLVGRCDEHTEQDVIDTYEWVRRECERHRALAAGASTLLDD